MKIYTGVGARATPPEVMTELTGYAAILAAAGFTGRSGGSEGADEAIEEGIDLVSGAKEIYLPWPGHNGSKSKLYAVCEKAYRIASEVHPKWRSLSDGVKKMHARNVYQVLGKDLTSPSDFLLCWTLDGIETAAERTRKSGGTATAIVIADRWDIPVFNLGRPGSRALFHAFLARSDVAGFRLSIQDALAALTVAIVRNASARGGVNA